ncbi:MAG TPA: HutD family protein [Paucimonas sp.]|nr:HutD family protein [Paucimonas sp.]
MREGERLATAFHYTLTARTMKLLRYEDLTASPWKNGGGVTRELACHPPGAGLDDFVWRVSIADVAASGPFSHFPGIERIIMLLDGGGMHLQFENGKRHALTEALHPYRFRGEATVHAQLAGGPSVDFNLMFRRDKAEGQVLVWRSANTLASGFVLLHCVAGVWQVGERHLQARDTLSGEIPIGTSIQPLQEHSALIGIHIEHHPENQC